MGAGSCHELKTIGYAESAIRYVRRCQLHRAWQLDPTLPGSTLALSESDEARVEAWLVEHHGVVLVSGLRDKGYPYSARCVDRLRWAAVLALTGRIDDERARRRVIVALRDDLRFWLKTHGEPTP